MLNEQRVRALLFYLSLLIFFSGLPFLLSFALGYKFDSRAFKFTKTGLIVFKTQPAGASVYLNGKLLAEKTPTSVNELLPGKYRVGIELEQHYAWFGEVKVEAGKVARLDKIILFPLRPDIKQLNKDNFSWFWVDTQTNNIYYVSEEALGIYRSSPEGDYPEKVADFQELHPHPKKWLLSEDRKRLLYFNPHKIVVTRVNHRKEGEPQEEPFALDYPDRAILDAFWHSDNYHVVIVTSKDIEAVETKPRLSPVTLVSLNKKNTVSSYDAKTDTLYFTDSVKAEDGSLYDNLYKMQLKNKFYSFQDLIKITPDIEKERYDADREQNP